MGGLLGFTAFSANVALIVMGLYFALALYAFAGGWWQKSGSRQIPLMWFTALPTVLFLAMWFGGQPIWVLIWFFAKGTDPDPTLRILIAIAVPTAVCARMAMGYASRRFMRICLFGSISIGCLMGAAWLHDFASQIQGWSARGAVENMYANWPSNLDSPFVDPKAPMRIVADPETYAGWEGKAYAIYFGPVKVSSVKVYPHGPWWWKSASSQPSLPVWKNWEREVRQLPNQDRENAAEKLEAIVLQYPNSEASALAESLLRELEALPDDGT